METASIITLVLILLCGFVLIGLSISNMKSTHPVGFYAGEPHPKDDDITDIKAYNTKHGQMWIAYGIDYILVFLASFLPLNHYVYVALLTVVLIGKAIYIIWNHNNLQKMYHI